MVAFGHWIGGRKAFGEESDADGRKLGAKSNVRH
jgi:hypothetical protein